MTQTTNFAAKAQEANEKLNAARARIAVLTDIAPKAHAEAQRLTNKLHILRSSDFGVSMQDSDAYETEISRQLSIRDAARAEKEAIESSSSFKELISFVTFAAHRKDTSHADELSAARAAWAEAITPHLALVERIRAAKKALGQHGGLLSNEELLSGVAELR